MLSSKKVAPQGRAVEFLECTNSPNGFLHSEGRLDSLGA